MQKLLFLDTETTGKEKDDRLCQIAYSIKKRENDFKDQLTPENHYFKPPLPISVGAMAVHHITNKAVDGCESFDGSQVKAFLQSLENVVLVAHNARFDVEMLAREGVHFPVWIDTLRVARHLIDSPVYQLQYLRYSLDLEVTGTAHDAAGDVNVLEALFWNLANKLIEQPEVGHIDKAIDRMVTLSSLPVLLKRFNFGKYEGQTFEEVAAKDLQYLRWLYSSIMSKLEGERDEDLLHTLKFYF